MAAENNGLSRKTAKAGIWTIGSRILAKGLDFVALILLAHFLAPTDFGIIAMAMTVVYIVEIVFDLPLAAALIRIPEPTERMYDTAFTLSAIRGLLVGALLAAIAWPLSLVYNEPRLVPLVLVLALAPIQRGLASPKMALFAKRMDFRRQAGLDVLSKCIAASGAIAVAAVTQSYWSIALGTILTPAILMAGSYWLAPMRPRLTLADWPMFSDMVGWNLVSQLVTAINFQTGRLVLPRFIGPHAFGNYAMAGDLSNVPFQIIAAPLGFPLNVAFVTSIQNGTLKQTYLKAVGGVFILLAPAFCIAAFLAGPLIHLFLGSKWAEAAPLLAGLAWVCFIDIPPLTMPSLAIALNQSRRIAMRNLKQVLVLFPLTVAGAWTWGTAGAIGAALVTAAYVTVLSMLDVKAMTSASLREQFISLSGPFAAIVVTAPILVGGAAFIGNEQSSLLLAAYLVAICSLYMAVYCALIYGLAVLFKDRDSAEGLMRQFVHIGLTRLKRFVI
jgi:O-antigen/teichoic acid export membrane protein